MSLGRALEAGTALGALVLVYALALGSFKPLDLLLGAVVGGLLLAAYRRFLFPQPALAPGALAARAVRLAPFLLVVAREILVGTWRVAVAVLRRDPAPASGVVGVPMGERSELGVAVSGLAISLTPGELVVDLDWERRVLLVHTLDGDDPERVRRTQQHLYERYQRGVFP